MDKCSAVMLSGHKPQVAASQERKRSTEPKPFAGLTTKPPY